MTHWAERVVADFLDAHGIRWLYEPTTFVLERKPNGQPARGFAPDFYLPDHGMYVEVTVQRPCTKKNGKVRMLREQHPELQVRLLNRSDVTRLLAGRFQLKELLEA